MLKKESGFSLVETLIAMGILATGLLSLAAVFAMGLNHLQGSSASLLAREKAREAVESVHTARDTRIITWAQIRNTDNGGVFVAGDPADPPPLREPGPDGLVNTADDGDIEVSIAPGADNMLGTADDVETPLDTYTRQIIISDIMVGGVPNPSLRRLTVTIGFRVGQTQRWYTLTTFISRIS
jgi:type II secretory pathway pseudopilin PulG